MAVLIRDDFDGAFGGTLVGRVPNITATGNSWVAVSNAAEGDWWALLLTGTGGALSDEVNPADGGGSTQSLAIPAVTDIRCELVIRGGNPTFDLSRATNMGAVRIDFTLGERSIGIEIGDNSMSFWPDDASPGGPSYGFTVGESGNDALFEIVWEGGFVRLFADGTPVAELAYDQPAGLGFAEVQVAGENVLDYIQFSDTSGPVGLPFWTAFRGSREIGAASPPPDLLHSEGEPTVFDSITAPYSGAVAVGVGYRWYKFTVSTDSWYRISTGASPDTAGDTFLAIYNSAGAIGPSNDDIDEGAENYLSQIDVELAAGVYWIVVAWHPGIAADNWSTTSGLVLPSGIQLDVTDIGAPP